MVFIGGGVRRQQALALPKQRFDAENTFTDAFNYRDVFDFRSHIFCPQTTQQLPKKHKETGPPQKLTNRLRTH